MVHQSCPIVIVEKTVQCFGNILCIIFSTVIAEIYVSIISQQGGSFIFGGKGGSLLFNRKSLPEAPTGPAGELLLNYGQILIPAPPKVATKTMKVAFVHTEFDPLSVDVSKLLS